MPGARKEFKGKEKGAEAKYQEQGNNIGEKRREQKQSAGARKEISGKETGAEGKCQEQGKNLREKRREQ